MKSIVPALLLSLIMTGLGVTSLAAAEPDEPPVYTFFGENAHGEFVTFTWQPEDETDHIANCFAYAPTGATCSNDGHDGLPAIHGFFVILDMFQGTLTSTINDGENVRTLVCYIEGYEAPACYAEGTWPESVPWRQDCVTLASGPWVCHSQHPEEP